MWQDPIVKETRALREQYSRKLENDVDAIFDDVRKRQQASQKKLVSFPPRKPATKPNVA
ncbi:MAG: hypothetical protein WD356_02020 [Pseudomonadales bacterium]